MKSPIGFDKVVEILSKVSCPKEVRVLITQQNIQGYRNINNNTEYYYYIMIFLFPDTGKVLKTCCWWWKTTESGTEVTMSWSGSWCKCWFSPVCCPSKRRTQKLPKTFRIVETYRHDHSLESSGGALSDGTISSAQVLKKLRQYPMLTCFLKALETGMNW
jgi:hypothetical protein